MKRSLLLTVLAALTAFPVSSSLAQSGDAPPLDAAQLLQKLKELREINDTGIKNRRNSAYQQVASALGSPEKAVAFWKEAVKSAQFEGAEREGAQIRDWREGDGEALNDKFGQNAVYLHLRWLALTLQHANGIETKQLLPQVIDYTRAVLADEANAVKFAEQLEKAKERNESGKHGAAKKTAGEDALVKRVHDQILRTGVGGSPVARWLQLSDLLGADSGKRQKNANAANPANPANAANAANAGPGSWEFTPGNVDGIYNNIILPEYRATKDPRLLEYWDMILKRETDRAAEKKLDVDQRDWAQIKRPSILWGRAQDVYLLGQRNRAVGDMFNIVKTFPQHPEAPGWITQIESMLMSASAPAPAASTVPTVPAATVAPGSVPPPVPVPSATAVPVPTAIIVPTPPATGPAVRR
jgi:hypothetical protein